MDCSPLPLLEQWVLLKCEHYIIIIKYLYNCVFIYDDHSLACDVFDNKLEVAKKVGADVVINTKTEDLKTAGY